MSNEEIIYDWEGVKQRFTAWWQGDLFDRPLVAITAPRKITVKSDRVQSVVPLTEPYGPASPDKISAQWTDVEVMIDRQEQILSRTCFFGEAIPVFWHNWSAGHALYFGCDPHFAEDTVWVDPAPVDDLGYPHLEGWELNPWWQWMQTATLRAASASRGRWMVMPMWGNHAGDNLGLVRGTERLLEDISTDRAWVRQAIQKLSDIQIAVFARLWDLVDPAITRVDGSINYVSCWSQGRTMAFDCDLSCMISPRDFKELFLPPLVETMATVDHRIYHLDGVVALQHLETLLKLPDLHAIQWIPGSGREEISQWFPLIQRVQAAGKSIAVYVQPDEIPLLIKECRPEGLFINTTCQDRDTALKIIDDLEKC